MILLLYLAAIVSGQTWPAPQFYQPPPVQIVPTIQSNGALNSSVLKITGTVEDATVGPVNIVNPYRGIETAQDAVMRRVLIDGFTATNVNRDGIRLFNAYDTTISNFKISFRAAPQTGTQLPEGIAIFKGSNIVIRNGAIDGFRTTGTGYLNGDGIATEGAVDGLSIEDVTASDNSDGGFDLKGRVTLDRVTSSRNSRNFRFWHTITAGTITSVDPRSGHIWVGKGSVIRIKKLIARSVTKAPILILDGGSITIDECDIQAPPGTPWSRTESSGNKLVMGPGCRI